MDNTLLYKKLISLPEKVKSEVIDFMDFLVSKDNKEALQKKPKFGSGRGMFTIKENFDDPIEDFKDYM